MLQNHFYLVTIQNRRHPHQVLSFQLWKYFSIVTFKSLHPLCHQFSLKTNYLLVFLWMRIASPGKRRRYHEEYMTSKPILHFIFSPTIYLIMIATWNNMFQTWIFSSIHKSIGDCLHTWSKLPVLKSVTETIQSLLWSRRFCVIVKKSTRERRRRSCLLYHTVLAVIATVHYCISVFPLIIYITLLQKDGIFSVCTLHAPAAGL